MTELLKDCGVENRREFVRLIWGTYVSHPSSVMGKGGGCYLLKSRGKLMRGDAWKGECVLFEVEDPHGSVPYSCPGRMVYDRGS